VVLSLEEAIMKSAMRAAALLLVFLLIPTIPFLILGEGFEASLLRSLQNPGSRTALCLWIVGLLAADILLPVPSSAVITYGGGILGVALSTVLSTVGLSIGGIIGFGLGRVWGEPVLRRFSDESDLVRLRQVVERYGIATLAMTRALPILAEACVLVLGTTNTISWRRFLTSLWICNGLLALSYSVCGAAFYNTDGFLPAVIASGALPLFITFLLRRVFLPVANPKVETPET
jgi:uncharacterized membrane protein YdjX (TVP38/TMEM64 family)